MRDLLIATNNRFKAAEIRALLAGLPVRFRDLSEFPDLPEAEESGATFEENALIKARYYERETGIGCVADDSGLEVDALDGRPGIISARYGGPGLSDADRYERVLQEMRFVPDDNRGGRYVCVAAFAGNGKELTAEGTVDGQILRAPRGKGGFGYDPIFFYPPLQRTFAEMTTGEKNSVSHRATAFSRLRTMLGRFLHEGR